MDKWKFRKELIMICAAALCMSLVAPAGAQAAVQTSDGPAVVTEVEESSQNEAGTADSTQLTETGAEEALQNETGNAEALQETDAPQSEDMTASAAEVTSGGAIAENQKQGLLEDAKGNLCYYEDGKAVKNSLRTIDGKTYFFAKDGIAARSEFVTYKSKTYYFDKDGVQVSGWQKIGGKKYYFKDNGAMVTGLKKLDDDYYYFDKDGAMVTGLKKVNGYKYFFKKNGRAVTGWKTIKGIKYFFKDNGRAATGWKTISGIKFYFLENGELASGWTTIKDNKYYFLKSGKYAVGLQHIDDAWYYFTDSGKRYTGLKKLDGSVYYFQDSGKALVDERKTIDGYTYYFNAKGQAKTDSWIQLDGLMYYANAQGRLQYYWQQLGGVWTLKKDSGEELYASDLLHSAWQKAQTMSSATEYLILVDTSACRTMIFQGKQGGWLPIKFWSCSPGASTSPTVKGTFTVGGKGYSFGDGFTCYYYTQFHGNYLFHSVLYQQGTFNVRDGRLGQNLSHGCVRLELDNAKWIYTNIPQGTTVCTY